MFKYILIIAYDGTHYHGWQTQLHVSSIQSLVEAALSFHLNQPTSVTGSARTDAGVHSLGQVAHFITNFTLDLAHLQDQLNDLLPSDIRIIDVKQVPLNFHARYSCILKEYHYHLHLERFIDPFKQRYAYHLKFPIDVERLKEGTALFIGEKNFASFANNSVKIIKNSTRKLYELSVYSEKGGLRLEFKGNGFLYKMVRNIVGTLVAVAQKKIEIGVINKIFEAKDRSRAYHPAPPQGLFLIRAYYEKGYLISSKEE